MLSSLIWKLPISFTVRAVIADRDARRAFALGVVDGLRAERETDESYIGRTWDDNQNANEAYDGGANLGQRVGRWLMSTTDAPFAQDDSTEKGR